MQKKQQLYLTLEIKMKRSLIIGMGIGQLYKDVLTNLKHETITVDPDPSKQADFTSTEDALAVYSRFDTAHICTPNFLHQQLAELVAPKSSIVFIEKPGFESAKHWADVIKRYPLTRFMMVKNNMWRDNIDELKKVVHDAKSIDLNWVNKDRVPNPGTWFTTKKLAYGGVSKDLMPHLLSLLAALDEDYSKSIVTFSKLEQKWELDDLTRSDYGTVNSNGVYDVDDYFEIEIKLNGKTWVLTSDWRSTDVDEQNIKFHLPSDITVVASLGLCPEEAYQAMIKDAIENLGVEEFWDNQYDIDMWIHEQIK